MPFDLDTTIRDYRKRDFSPDEMYAAMTADPEAQTALAAKNLKNPDQVRNYLEAQFAGAEMGKELSDYRQEHKKPSALERVVGAGLPLLGGAIAPEAGVGMTLASKGMNALTGLMSAAGFMSPPELKSPDNARNAVGAAFNVGRQVLPGGKITQALTKIPGMVGAAEGALTSMAGQAAEGKAPGEFDPMRVAGRAMVQGVPGAISERLMGRGSQKSATKAMERVLPNFGKDAASLPSEFTRAWKPLEQKAGKVDVLLQEYNQWKGSTAAIIGAPPPAALKARVDKFENATGLSLDDITPDMMKNIKDPHTFMTKAMDNIMLTGGGNPMKADAGKLLASQKKFDAFLDTATKLTGNARAVRTEAATWLMKNLSNPEANIGQVKERLQKIGANSINKLFQSNDAFDQISEIGHALERLKAVGNSPVLGASLVAGRGSTLFMRLGNTVHMLNPDVFADAIYQGKMPILGKMKQAVAELDKAGRNPLGGGQKTRALMNLGDAFSQLGVPSYKEEE